MAGGGDLWSPIFAQSFGMGIVAMIGLVSLWVPRAIPAIRELWFSLPNLIVLPPIPIWTLRDLGCALLPWSRHFVSRSRPGVRLAVYHLHLTLFA